MKKDKQPNQLQKSCGRDGARPSTAENRLFPKAVEGHVSSWPSFPGLLQLPQPKAIKVSAYECEPVRLKQRVNFKMVDPTTCGTKQFSFGMVIVEPKGTCEPGHSHEDQEEIFYCLNGRGIVIADDDQREIEIAPHEAVFFPPGTYHSIKNPYEIPLQALWILSPGGWVFDRNPTLKEIASGKSKPVPNKVMKTSLKTSI